MTLRPPIILTLAAAAVGLLAPAPAAATWVVPGRGFGDGVGMGQYGAYGLAQNGRSYQQILRHYYTGVEIEAVENQRIRVLLTSGVESVRFTGATKACGQSLRASRTYSFALNGTRVELRRANGSRIAGCGREGDAAGGASVVWKGIGRYRGKLVGRNVGGSLYAINDLTLESYVRGVVPLEMPTSWRPEALRAQAVAARSYALATRIGGDGYDLYDDTRSQVYEGMRYETARSDNATEVTRREVITAGGRVATAFFFSTSGGQTENSEFAYVEPRSYLKAVDDPFDLISPFHKWRLRFSNAEMEARLGPYFSGRLRKIRILKTGVSPRIVRAKVVGSQASSVVSGNSLRYALGLRSTWATFVKR
ncbi:MAG: SpoIID/LytB domain-containing protein [Actinomycetota bacterium]|nr:SpoIID/LytB domain-containing protein [Actinomycetota bacterium]